MDQEIQNIRETQHLLLKATDLTFKRSLFHKIDFQHRLIGLIGPRGVGKTTLILQYLKEKQAQDTDAIYFLADHILVKKGDLINLAREFHLKHGGKLICIDEIHRYENWNQELKNIYDTLPELKVIFSGSSSLNLIKGKYDLSRRGILYSLGGLSFSEYLKFEHQLNTDHISFKELIKNYQKISNDLTQPNSMLKYFNQYLKYGYYPFFKETKKQELYFQQINNIVEKTIYEDIASFYKLKTPNLITFKQILVFLASVAPGEININKLANSLGKNHATIAQYLEILHETNCVRFLTNNKTGHALIRNAKKVFLDNTNLMHALNFNLGKSPSVGTIRELFIHNQLQNAGHIPTYTQEGDLTVDSITLEIGGKNKTAKQIKDASQSYLVLDDILTGSKGRIPLYLFGLLY